MEKASRICYRISVVDRIFVLALGILDELVRAHGFEERGTTAFGDETPVTTGEPRSSSTLRGVRLASWAIRAEFWCTAESRRRRL